MNRGIDEPSEELSPTQKPPTPLLPLAVGLILGIALDEFMSPPTWVAALCVAVGFSVCLARRRSLTAVAIAVAVAALGLGLSRHAMAVRWLPSNHVVTFIPNEPILAKITGRVLTIPSIIEPDPDRPRAYPTPPKTKFLLTATPIEGYDGPIETTGKLTVSIKEPLLSLRAGDRVRITGWLYRPQPPQNPGAFDWAKRQRRRGILAGLSCDHAAGVIVTARSTGAGWQGTLDQLRQRLHGYLIEPAFSDNDETAGVIAAMVLGRRSAVERSMNEAFRKTGNAHFLAASGMHVAWLALIAWLVTRLLGLHPRIAALIVGGLILAYVLVAEPRPSIMRAGIIGLLACSAAFFRGRYNSVNALSCAAIIILMIQPADLFSPAFQFSFLATLGLLHFCPLVSRAIALWLFERNLPRTARLFSYIGFPVSLVDPQPEATTITPMFTNRIGSFFAQLLALSISEWLITAPLACYHFNQFAPWGWFGTFVLAPLAMLATSVGFCTVLLGLVFPSSGVVMGPILAAVADLMVGCVKLLAQVPATLLDGRSPSVVWLAAVYGTFWLWGYRRNWMPHRHGFKIIIAVLILWWLIPPRWTRHEGDALNVWMLAVGDGTGTVIELPDGRVMLYDFGTRSPFDAGILGVNFLKHRGIRNIDTVFVSHPNFDHFGGIETIAEQFTIGRVVINDQFETFVEEKSAGWYFLKSIRDRGIRIEVAHGPQRFVDGPDVVVESIWPPPLADRRSPNANDSSTVLRITYRGKSILLTGDIAQWGIGGLLYEREVQLHADVLALPHHGSIIHNTADFIKAVAPQFTIRSTAQRRAMTTNNIETIVGKQRAYFNTADHGCIRVRIQDGTVKVSATTQIDP